MRKAQCFISLCVLLFAAVFNAKFSNAKEKNYQIGDIGPAGGWIFYVKKNNSDGWKYLEAAPEDQSDGIKWDNGALIDTKAEDKKVGDGSSNTEKIISSQGDGSYAAKLCADYTGGGKNDWYLPSRNELNLMYKNLHKKDIGNFSNDYYWSSNELGKGYVKYAIYIDFSDGQVYRNYKTTKKRVRAARAF